MTGKHINFIFIGLFDIQTYKRDRRFEERVEREGLPDEHHDYKGIVVFLFLLFACIGTARNLIVCVIGVGNVLFLKKLIRFLECSWNHQYLGSLAK